MKMISKILKGFSLSLILVLFLSGAVQASSTGVSAVKPAQTDAEQILNLTLSDLGLTEDILLQGSYRQSSILFSLPADWIVSDAVQFDLRVLSDFQSLLQAFVEGGDEITAQNNLTGLLAVNLNGNAAGEFTIDHSGEYAFQVTLAPDWFSQNGGLNELTFTWDASLACQYGVTTTIGLSADSTVALPVMKRAVQLDLHDFPNPFYTTENIQPYTLALVIPDDAGKSELSALMAVAAGLGKHSQGQLDYEVVLLSEASQNLADHQLVFIGLATDLEDFLTAEMPEIELAKVDDPDTGIVQLARSGWNDGRAVLLVTGANEQALSKASASIAAQDWLPFADASKAFISEVSDTLSAQQFEIDQELGSLSGDSDLMVEAIGEQTVDLVFNIPADTQISSEAYIELYFRHSQLIDYLQSSLSVSVNGSKVGSVRFSDQSAENGLSRILLPANVLQPLKNELKITYTIVPQDICADERSGNYWVSVYEDSYLHLAPIMDEAHVQTRTYLNDLPDALLGSHAFSNLVLMASEGDWQSWRYAVDFAFNLGMKSASDVFMPMVEFTGDGIKEDGLAYILIGRTDDVPFSTGLNEQLPLPFLEDGSADLLPLGGVQFEMDATQSLGFLELVDVVSSGTLVYAILGNSQTGLTAAVEKAVHDLSEPVTETANVDMIEKESYSHYFLVEPKTIAVEGEPQVQLKWYQVILGANMEKMDAYLLLGSLLLTVVFVFLFFIAKPKKKK